MRIEPAVALRMVADEAERYNLGGLDGDQTVAAPQVVFDAALDSSFTMAGDPYLFQRFRLKMKTPKYGMDCVGPPLSFPTRHKGRPHSTSQLFSKDFGTPPFGTGPEWDTSLNRHFRAPRFPTQKYRIPSL